MSNIKKKIKEASPILNNTDVLQSYIITVAKYNFSIYEKRIMYRIIDMIQIMVNGQKLGKDFKIDEDLYGGKFFTLLISSILMGDKDKNHLRIKKAITSLQKKLLIYEDENIWQSITLIVNPEIRKHKRSVTFSLHKKIYDVLLDFSKGFRKYELKTAISLKSVYSMRFYELFSEQKNTITYSIKTLKRMFKAEEKYKETKDFVKRVVLPAQKELNKSSPYSFAFTPVKTGKKITAITFTPVYHSKNRDEKLETQKLKRNVDLYWSISEKNKIILQDKYKFTTTELKRHSKLWEIAEKELNLHMELEKIEEKALKATNPKGYIITSLKNMIKVFENSNNSITPNTVKKQTRKFKKIKSNSIVDVEQILETENEVYTSNKAENIYTIKSTNIHTVTTINEKPKSSGFVENTSDKTVETTKKLINHINSFETIIDGAKVDNERHHTPEILITQTEVNISNNKPAFSFLQKISKWIICQFKRKE